MMKRSFSKSKLLRGSALGLATIAAATLPQAPWQSYNLGASPAYAQEVDCAANPDAEGCLQPGAEEPAGVRKGKKDKQAKGKQAKGKQAKGKQAQENQAQENQGRKKKAGQRDGGETAGAAGAAGGQDNTRQAEEQPAVANPIEKVEEAPPVQQVQEQPVPESSPAAEQKPGKKKKKQDAARKQERKKKAAEEATAEQPGATGDVVAAPQPSPDAPKPEPVAEAPIEKQIEKAEETQTAVVPEKITAGQREELKKAEKKRRKKARENREELLGAAAAGAVIGALVPILGGKVVGDEGDRVIVERNGEFMVRRDESALFRDTADRIAVEHLPRGRTMETVYRRDGSQIVTIRDAGGYLLYRKKVTRQGREIVLYDARNIDRRHVDYDRELPPIRLTIPRDQYIVPARGYGRRQLAEVFAAPPVETLRQHYTLREVRESERLRNIVRRVDLDTITFDSGSYYVAQSQVGYLADIAGGMLDVIDENPEAVFLVEGHTDAVGSDLYNLTLSDRRAETVARILSEAYDVPPENLVVEGYGEQYLKIDTQGDERRNRRVTIRNISPLLETAGN